MIEKAKENWRCLKESEPGYRFKDRYHQRQQSRGDGFSLRAVFIMSLGTLVVLVGIIAVPGPGPGWLIILLGLGILANFELPFFSRTPLRYPGGAPREEEQRTGPFRLL